MKADFDDIIGTQIISGELFFKFKYDVAPKIRLVSEKLAPKNLISQFYKRENLNDPKLVGPIDSCHISKEFQCFNKSKTKGYIFIKFI